MQYDTYDLIISYMGFDNPALGITKKVLEKKFGEISALAEELGIAQVSDRFNLILMDDNEHDQLEVISDLLDIGCGKESFDIMKQAHMTGSAIVTSGRYVEMKKLRDELSRYNYRVIIKKIEKK